MISEGISTAFGEPWLKPADGLRCAIVLPTGSDSLPISKLHSPTSRISRFPWEIAVVATGSLLGAAVVIAAIAGILPAGIWRSLGQQSPIERGTLTVLAVFLILALTLLAEGLVERFRARSADRVRREQKDRLACAADAAAIGLWHWDSKANRLFANTQCRAILGVVGEIASTGPTDIVHPGDRAKARAELDAALAERHAFDIQYRILSENGDVRWIRSHGQGNWRAEMLEQVAGTVVDVSSQINTESDEKTKSLMHLARVAMVGELSGALAHELNQPLTAIMSNAQAAERLMKQAPLNASEVQGAISDIVKNAARAGEVIRHLRGLLKQDRAHRESLDVNRLLGDALELAHSDLIARHIMVAPRMSPAKLAVRGDPVQLQQVFLNLIVNAAEAMSTAGNGVLLVSTDTVDGEIVHVALSDNGPGIDPKLMERLFEPFFSTKPQGLGLGLSISRAIVTSHGGMLWAANNPGHGATFHVRLPGDSWKEAS